MKGQRLTAGAIATAVLVAGCGGGSDGPLGETADRLAEVESGTIDLRLETAAVGAPEGEVVGFAVAGPFSVAGDGKYPVADLEYTTLAGAESTASGLLSTGDAVFVEVEGQAYELPDDQAAPLALPEGSGGALEVLRLDQWIVDPATEEDDLVRIHGEADVPVVMADLLAMSAGFGAPGLTALPALEGQRAEALEQAVLSSQVEVVTGTEDHLLRHLRFDLELAADLSPELEPVLGAYAGLTMVFELTLADHDADVRVPPPPDPLPFDELG